MSIALSRREQEMLAAVIKEMNGLPAVDYAKVAMSTGQKYPKNARSAFKRIWDKLKGGPHAVSSGEGGTESARKPSVRGRPKKTAGPKKTVGPKKVPRKASAKARAAMRKIKKEDSVETEESIKAGSDEGSDDEVIIKTEKYDEGGSSQEDEVSTYEDGHDISEEIPEVGEDEASAYLLGVPLEEYKELAKETGHSEDCKEEVNDENYATYTPTPRGPTFSDEGDVA